MNMKVKNKSWAEKFVEWVFSLPNYLGIIFVPLVVLLYVASVVINKLKGV